MWAANSRNDWPGARWPRNDSSPLRHQSEDVHYSRWTLVAVQHTLATDACQSVLIVRAGPAKHHTVQELTKTRNDV
jgi:hypothetical protein